MDTIINYELEALKIELIQLKSKLPLNLAAILIQLDKVGKKCQYLGKYNEALSYYKECLEIQKGILPPNHPDIANSLNNIGIVYYHQRKYEEALKCYHQLLEIYKQFFPFNQPLIAEILNNIGLIYINQGKCEKALKHYNQSLEIYKQILPSNHSLIAEILYNIGFVYLNQRKYEEALKYLNRSLEMKKQTLPSNHPDIADALKNIGLVYDGHGKYEEALKCFNQSLEIYKQILPSNHSLIAKIHYNIGFVYLNQRKYEEALKYFNQSLEIFKQALPSNHPDIADALNNIGFVYSHQGKYEKALKYYNQSLEMRKQTLPSTHPAILNSLKNINEIGKVFYDQGKYEQAINYLTDEKIKEECRQKLREKQQKKNAIQTERNIQRDISQLSLSSSSSSKNVDIEDPYIGKVFNVRYKVSKKLGSGSFGFVYRVKDMTVNKEELRDGNRAMKIMNKCHSETENELKIFWKINHENIVKYIDHFHIKIGSDDKTCLLTEFCENGDLKHHINERKISGRNFNEKDILKWMCQATNALKYLHSMEPKPIIHRDIKPANMLLSDTMQIKIADLGLSKIIESEKTHASTQAGTPLYMSPEVYRALIDDVKHYPNTDVWSLGCVLHELFFLEYAFPRGQRGNPPLPSNLSSCGIFSAILPKMLEKDPLVRIKSKKLMKEFILLDEDE